MQDPYELLTNGKPYGIITLFVRIPVVCPNGGSALSKETAFRIYTHKFTKKEEMKHANL